MARGHIGYRDGKLGRSWYYTAPVPDRGDGKPGQKQKRGFKTKKEAEKALREVLAAVDDGSYRAVAAQTVAEYLEYWLEHKKRGIKPSSHAKYSHVVRTQLVPALGCYALDKLGTLEIDRYYTESLAAGVSANQLRYNHAILKCALSRAVKWKLIRENPVKDAELPKAPAGLETEDRHIYALEDHEARRLLDQVDGRLWLAVMLSLNTGMRRGEVLGLRWKDVDFATGRIHVRQALLEGTGKPEAGGLPARVGPPKSDKSIRDFRAPDDLLDELRRYRGRQSEEFLAMPREKLHELDLVICWDDGRFVSPKVFSAWFRKARNAANLPRLRFHDLRHTFATNQLRSGVDVTTVSKQLGHASPAITLQVYSGVLPSMQERAAATANETLRRVVGGSLARSSVVWPAEIADPDAITPDQLWAQFLAWRSAARAPEQGFPSLALAID